MWFEEKSPSCDLKYFEWDECPNFVNRLTDLFKFFATLKLKWCIDQRKRGKQFKLWLELFQMRRRRLDEHPNFVNRLLHLFKFVTTSELKWCIGQRKMKNTIISIEPLFLALLQRVSGSVADVSSHPPGPSSAAFVRTAEGHSSKLTTAAGLTLSAGSGFRKWGLPTRSSWSPSTASITYHRQGENFALIRLVGWSIQSFTIHQ